MPDEIKKLQELGIRFVAYAASTNAETMRLALDGVTILGEQLGDWEIIVKKKGTTKPV